MAWTYPASPFTAVRLKVLGKRLGIPIQFTDSFSGLRQQWNDIKDAQFWKTSEGARSATSMGDMRRLFPGLETKPRPYQLCAYGFIRDLEGGYLAMDMGTGKTLVVLMHMLVTKPSLTLIVCPCSVLEVWPDEMQRHVPSFYEESRVTVLDMGNSEKKAEKIDQDLALMRVDGRRQVFIVNYESMWRDAIAERLLAIRWDLCVMDEAHRLKTNSGAASRFAAKLMPQCGNRLALSGTPLPNSRLDGFAQYRFLDPGVFGTNYTNHKKKYAVMGGYQNYQVIGWRNEQEFNKLLGYLMFRVDKSILQLPPIRHVRRYVHMPQNALRTYRDVAEEFTTAVSAGLVTASNALARLVKLREVTSGFVITDDGEVQRLHEAKKEALIDALTDIPPDEKIVIFHQFKYERQDIKDALDYLGRTWGEVSGDQKDTEGGRIPANINTLICQTRAGGLGLNLTDARYEVFFSVDFNLADHDQAEARVHRGGQEHEVICIHLICPGTVDEVVYKALEQKRNIIETILEYVKTGGQL